MQRFEDPILRRFEHNSRERLTVRLGPNYRGYETFELRRYSRTAL